MNTPNPYESPSAVVEEAGLPRARDIPDEIARPIRHGFVAACASGAITLLMVVTGLMASSDIRFDAWNLLDVGLIALLAFGIHKRSRTAATVMLAYFVLSKILMMVETGKPTGLVMGLLFAIFYFRAMTATFRYHRFLKEWQRNPPAPRRSLSEDPFFATKAPDNGAG